MTVRLAILLASAAAACSTGCTPRCPEDYSQAPETHVSLRQLVAEYNANAAAVPRLWARAHVKLTVADDKGRTGLALPSINALVLMDKFGSRDGSADLVMVGRELSAELFRVGVDRSSGLYYFWYDYGRQRGAWAGRIDLAGAPGVRSVPVDPLQLLAVLGVTELPSVGPDRMPAVVLRMQGSPPEYVVRYLKPQPVTGELKVWREVCFAWTDKPPCRPHCVRLFDADGFCRVVAELSEYEKIDAGDEGTPQPEMPTRLRLCWPAIKGVQPASELRIALSEMTTTKELPREAYEFASHLPGGVAVESVDPNYGPDGEGPDR